MTEAFLGRLARQGQVDLACSAPALILMGDWCGLFRHRSTESPGLLDHLATEITIDRQPLNAAGIRPPILDNAC
jgi:hypothetical protein